jgi:hypothetical protein
MWTNIHTARYESMERCLITLTINSSTVPERQGYGPSAMLQPSVNVLYDSVCTVHMLTALQHCLHKDDDDDYYYHYYYYYHHNHHYYYCLLLLLFLLLLHHYYSCSYYY